MNWDQILVFAVVLAATAYLFTRWRAGRKGACGGCGSCGTEKQPPKSPTAPPVLIQLDATPRRRSGSATPITPGSGRSQR